MRPNKTDAGNGSKAICRVIGPLRSPSPDPKRSRQPRSAMRFSTALIALVVCFVSACSRNNSSMDDIPAANQSDDRGLFLSWKHPNSHRAAILEEMDGMVWLYLSQPDSTKPARDCPAFVTTAPPDTIDWKLVAQTGEPPRISKDVASDRALIEHPAATDFSTVWSLDGESVGLRHRGEIISMIVAGQQRGHSRALRSTSPLGLPFDDVLATSIFTSSPPQR